MTPRPRPTSSCRLSTRHWAAGLVMQRRSILMMAMDAARCTRCEELFSSSPTSSAEQVVSSSGNAASQRQQVAAGDRDDLGFCFSCGFEFWFGYGFGFGVGLSSGASCVLTTHVWITVVCTFTFTLGSRWRPFYPSFDMHHDCARTGLILSSAAAQSSLFLPTAVLEAQESNVVESYFYITSNLA